MSAPSPEDLARALEDAGEPDKAHAVRHAAQWASLVDSMPDWARRVVSLQLDQAQDLAVRCARLENEVVLLAGVKLGDKGSVSGADVLASYAGTSRVLEDRLGSPAGGATFVPGDPLWPMVRMLVPEDAGVPVRIDVLRALREWLVDPENPPWHLSWTTGSGTVTWTLVPNGDLAEVFA